MPIEHKKKTGYCTGERTFLLFKMWPLFVLYVILVSFFKFSLTNETSEIERLYDRPYEPTSLTLLYICLRPRQTMQIFIDTLSCYIYTRV